MVRKNKGKEEKFEKWEKLRPDTKKSVLAITFGGAATVLFLSSIGKAGPLGGALFSGLDALFGLGFYLVPALMAIVAVVFLFSREDKLIGLTLSGAVLFVIAGLGTIDIIFPDKAGLTGSLVGLVEVPFGYVAALVIGFTALAASLLVTLNVPLKLRLPARKNAEESRAVSEIKEAAAPKIAEPASDVAYEKASTLVEGEAGKEKEVMAVRRVAPAMSKNYKTPPLSLLKSGTDKPSAGDLRANANIIKRTLDGFGIPVEMGEINIGPKVTRYTLKPAEGVKLTRITALNQDLSLALAAHPIRIEAPIPGKSL